MCIEVFIALGTNLGDRAANLETALVGLAEFISDIERSPIYESAPKYVSDQPMFLNMVARGRTTLTAPDLLAVLKILESNMGREAGVRNGPRLIDLDIVYYGDGVIESPYLSVPHPRLRERAFVLRPLFDIDPDRRDPVSRETVRQMLAALPDLDDLTPL
jgi:2-amino-4-hydroxy-6-hydroxymethyldihydropteridine diphosphokinase